MITTNQTPDLTAMTREELLEYGNLGRRESAEVSLALIRRHRETTKW
jgi:hypothetical protein